jgi:hypothetical protein
MQRIFLQAKTFNTQNRSDATVGSMLKESRQRVCTNFALPVPSSVSHFSPDNAAAGPINELFVNAHSLCGCIIVSECVSSDHKWVISSEKFWQRPFTLGCARAACVRAYFASALAAFKMPEHFRHSANISLVSVCTHTSFVFVLLWNWSTSNHTSLPNNFIAAPVTSIFLHAKQAVWPIELIDQPGHRRRIGKAVSFISRQTASKCSHTRAFRFKWHFLFALRALVKSTSAIKCKFHFMNGIVNSQFMVATVAFFADVFKIWIVALKKNWNLLLY